MKTFSSFLLERQQDIDDSELMTRPAKTHEELMERINDLGVIKIGEGGSAAVYYGPHEGDYVIRIADGNYDKWPVWIQNVKNNTSFNPYLPQVLSPVYKMGDGNYCILEKLSKSDNHIDDLLQAFYAREIFNDLNLGDFKQFAENEREVFGAAYLFCRILQKSLDFYSLSITSKGDPYNRRGIYGLDINTVLDIYDLFIKYHGGKNGYMDKAFALVLRAREKANAALDIHDENWLFRGKTPVITDPIA